MDVIQRRIILSEYQGYEFRVALPPVIDFRILKENEIPEMPRLPVAVYRYVVRDGYHSYVYEFAGVEVK